MEPQTNMSDKSLKVVTAFDRRALKKLLNRMKS